MTSTSSVQDSSIATRISKLDQKSRFKLTRLHGDTARDRSVLRWGIWNRPKIDMTKYYVYTLQISDVGRLDRVSFQFYGHERFWWAIADVNGIKNVLADIVPGEVIQIPLESAIQRALTEGSTSLFY